MNILELKEKQLTLKKRMRAVLATGKSENRELTEDEQVELEQIKDELEILQEKIANIESENENLEPEKPMETNSKTNLIKMINSVVEGRSFTENEAKAINEAKQEMRKSGLSSKGQIVLRTIAAGTATKGQENVSEEKKSLELAIRNNLVASQMGADWLSGLVGDVSIPIYSGSSVKWAGETTTAEDGQGAFSEVVLTPHRITATVDISKQFLLQDSSDAEALLISDLAAAVAEKLDSTIFGAGAGDANTPAGLFNGVTASGSLGDAAYADVLALEQAVEEANGSDYMFVVNPKVKFALKGTQVASGLAMVYDNNEIDGYKAISSNSVVANGILCINPKMLVIGQWGGIDILVDPYTKAGDGQVRLVVNAYFDAKLRGDQIGTKVFA